MRTLILSLAPALALALAPTLVSERTSGADPRQFLSPSTTYGAKVEYGTANTEFVPFERFELVDATGVTVYARSGGRHTLLDVADNGLVVGVDFDGPVSGRARLHFYDLRGRETGTAEIGFWDRHGFSASGNVYCVLDGTQGLRVFSSAGRELYNAGRCNRFAVSADGQHVALATDTEIQLLQHGEPVAEVPLAAPFVRGMAFSPDGERFGYCERHTLYVHRVSDAAVDLQYRPEDARMQFMSLDVGNRLVLAGLDFDGGRGTSDRHRRGLAVMLDSAGSEAWKQKLTYERWSITMPDVRFGTHQTFAVKTADETRTYRYQED